METETGEEGGEGIKVGDLANSDTNKLENTLPQDIDSFPNRDSISNGSIANLSSINSVVLSTAETSFPTSVTSAELFEIQIREIDEDMIKYGQNTGVMVKPFSAISEKINPRVQSESILEGGKSREGSKQVTREPQAENTRGSILKGSPKINPTSNNKPSVTRKIKKQNRAGVRWQH
nr:hypothetical protein CFP56_13756 [Quercus suber]